MRKNSKKKNKKQMEMDLQVTGVSQQTKSTQINKPKSVKAKRSNTGLSKKSTKGKVKRKACGHRKPSGTLFDNLITVEELAVIFGLAPQTIRNWVAQGKLPRVKLGKRNWFLTGSLQKWLNQKEESRWQ